MNGQQTGELIVMILCFSAYILYTLWYFRHALPRGLAWLSAWAQRLHAPTSVRLWEITVWTRASWVEDMMSDPKEAITAVQTVRNMVIGVSILAAANAALIGQMMGILTDASKITQVSKLAEADPITGGSWLVSPEVKVGLSLGALFLSLLSFAHSVRLSIHLGFVVRVVPKHGSPALRRQAVLMSERAALFFAIGLRFLYAFIPLAMWLLGALSLLITTLLLLLALFFLDRVPQGGSEDGDQELQHVQANPGEHLR